MQKHLTITIHGKQYSIATDENDHDIYTAVQLVESLLKGNLEKMPPNSDHKAVLAVALRLATDLVKNQHVLKTYEQKVGQLVDFMEDI